MIKCRETFDDIVMVWPFAEGEINYKIPFNVRSRTIAVSDMGAETLSDLCKGKPYYSIGENYEEADCVELAERKCSLKATSKHISSGRAFDVSLVLIINEKSVVSATMMDQLESSRHDFIVQCADGSHLLVRSANMAYKCVSEEEFAESYQQKLTFTLENYNGIQRIN